jgi:hypothetical protein
MATDAEHVATGAEDVAAETQSVATAASDDTLPEPHESRLTDAGPAPTSTKREVALAIARQRDPLVARSTLADLTDNSGRTVSRAVEGLQMDDIVQVKEIGSTHAYHLNHPHSEYAMPPDITPQAEAPHSPLERAEFEEVLTMRDPDALHTAALGTVIISTAMIIADMGLSAAGVSTAAQFEAGLAGSGFVALAVALTLSVGQHIVSRVTDRI